MVKPRRINDRHLAYYIVGTQALIACILPLVTLLVVGKKSVIAAFCGGCIAAVANSYFAIQAFRYSGASASSQMVKSFYRGEAGKFILVLLLFVIAFKFIEGAKQQAHILMICFVCVQSVSWFAPLVLRRY